MFGNTLNFVTQDFAVVRNCTIPDDHTASERALPESEPSSPDDATLTFLHFVYLCYLWAFYYLESRGLRDSDKDKEI